MKYYIKIVDNRFNRNRVMYKRYKCIDGLTSDKSICWKFSRQGAKQIIERMKEYEYHDVLDQVEISLEKAE